MQQLKQSILKAIAYFDVFDYPISIDEIKYFLDRPFTEAELFTALHQLQQYNDVYRFEKFYSLRNEYALIERRKKGNKLAEKKLKLAKKISKFLMWFPYIKGVAVSGSLSKNFAYQGSDIDFFIITSANRLWLARMFFICFYTLAKLTGFKNYFCLNYFIDETALAIPEENIYTAVEIATLLPRQGSDLFRKFYAENEWVNGYLPNYMPRHKRASDRKGPLIKRLLEWLLNNKAGDKLDDLLMRFYNQRWAKMMAQKRYSKTGFLFGSYIAAKHVCKPIPHYFQQKILKRFDDRMQLIDNMIITREQVAV